MVGRKRVRMTLVLRFMVAKPNDKRWASNKDVSGKEAKCDLPKRGGRHLMLGLERLKYRRSIVEKRQSR